MGARLDDAGAVEHDDEVGHAHGREAVRHEDRDAAVVARCRATRPRTVRTARARSRRRARRSARRARSSNGSLAHEPARERELLPLPESTARRRRATSDRVGCRARPACASTTSTAPARPTAASTAGSSSMRGWSPTPTVACASELEAEEVLERARRGARATRRRAMRAEIDAVDRDAAVGRLVHTGKQLHERASCPRRSRRRARPPMPAGSSRFDVVEHLALGARVRGTTRARSGSPSGERVRARSRPAMPTPCSPRSPRATRAAATASSRPAQELGLADGDAEVAATGGCPRRATSTTSPTLASSPDAT